jgi:hypothetical protein
VPLIVVWPGQVKAGSRNATPVSSIDFYPTMISMAGIKKPQGQVIDGLNLVPLLTGKGGIKRDALFNYFPGGGPTKPGGVTVREGDWKLIRWYETGPDFPELLELYNLKDDLGETKNLASELPDKVQHLNELIAAWVKRANVKEPKPNPAYDPNFRQRQNAEGRAVDNDLKGWVPKGIRASADENGLTLEAAGKAPFVANVQLQKLKRPGPYRLEVRFAGNASGAGKIQWRTTRQERFPDKGQVQSFKVESGSKRLIVEAPVDGTLRHIRFYPPVADGPVTIQTMRLLPGRPGEAKALVGWDFRKR